MLWGKKTSTLWRNANSGFVIVSFHEWGWGRSKFKLLPYPAKWVFCDHRKDVTLQHTTTPLAWASFESEPHSEGFTAFQSMVLQRAVCASSRLLFKQECSGTPILMLLYFCLLYLFYVLCPSKQFYFTPDACRKRGTLNSQKDGWECVKLLWYIPSVTYTALCLMRLCTVNAVFKRKKTWKF